MATNTTPAKSTPINRKAEPKAAAKKAAPAAKPMTKAPAAKPATKTAKPAAKKAAPKAIVFKPGSFYNYRTPTGKTGRMKVTSVRGGKGQPGGTWVTGTDKDTKAEISLRPGCLSA